jgi:hypothetical protein
MTDPSRHCGATTKHGTPCQQPPTCPFHKSPELLHAHQSLAGRHNRRPLRLPEDSPIPRFRTQQDVLDYSEQSAHLVATGHLDPKLSMEMRGWCMVALAAHELAALDRLHRLERMLKARRG